MIRPEDMQVAVLMGGLGTRLLEYTKECPKPLVDVCGKPFFHYQLTLMAKQGFKKFLFLIGYRAEMIEEYFGDGSAYGVSIRYCYDGKELLGTGGAVRRAFPYLEDDFLLMYGDSFMDIDFEESLYRYEEGKKQGAKALMTVLLNQGKYDKSNVIMQDGRLVLYDKKNPLPEMNAIDYGICIYEKSVFASYEENVKFDVAQIQNTLSAVGEMVPHVVTRRFYEIGSPASLMEFTEYVKHRFHEAHPAVFLDRDGVINEIVFNENTEQLDSPLCVEEFHFRPNAEKALHILQEKGYYIFVVTNQPAAAKGKTTLGRLYDINTHMMLVMQEQGVFIEEVKMCPHTDKEVSHTKYRELVVKCKCRKPGTGLFEKIAEKYNLDIGRSFMAGDSYTDIEAGRSFGVKTVFLGNYKCDVCARLKYNKPDFIFDDLYHFADSL